MPTVCLLRSATSLFERQHIASVHRSAAIIKTLSSFPCRRSILTYVGLVGTQVGDDEDEVRLAQAQVLMDCIADLLSQKGLDGTRAWCEGGLKLRQKSDAWFVLGRLPENEGQGQSAASLLAILMMKHVLHVPKRVAPTCATTISSCMYHNGQPGPMLLEL